MRKHIKWAAAALLAAACMHAQAGGDRWGDANVKKHFAGEALIAATVTGITDNRAAGIAASLAVGVAREEWKRRNGYAHYSQSRVVSDVAGALLGAQFGHCVAAWRSFSCLWGF